MSAKPIAERAWANVALIAAIGTVLVAVLRVYAWSGFYIPVALSVLSIADRTTLLASTLLIALISLTPLLLSELFFSQHFSLKKLVSPDTSPLDILRIYSVSAALLVALYGFAPIFVALVIGGLGALALIIWTVVIVVNRIKHGRAAARTTANARLFDSKFSLTPLVVLTCCGVMFGVGSQPWLPLESIGTTSGTESVVGYVIGESGPFTLVVDEHKTSNWLQTASLESRQVCLRTQPEFVYRTFANVLSSVQLPDCPQVSESRRTK